MLDDAESYYLFNYPGGALNGHEVPAGTYALVNQRPFLLGKNKVRPFMDKFTRMGCVRHVGLTSIKAADLEQSIGKSVKIIPPKVRKNAMDFVSLEDLAFYCMRPDMPDRAHWMRETARMVMYSTRKKNGGKSHTTGRRRPHVQHGARLPGHRDPAVSPPRREHVGRREPVHVRTHYFAHAPPWAQPRCRCG